MFSTHCSESIGFKDVKTAKYEKETVCNEHFDMILRPFVHHSNRRKKIDHLLENDVTIFSTLQNKMSF